MAGSDAKNAELNYMKPQKTVSGLGGWLLLPLLGLFVTPIIIGVALMTTYAPLFGTGGWEMLTNPESEYYHPLWGPLLIFEIVGNSFFMVFAVVLVVFFLQKNTLLPRWIIIYMVANAIFLLTDYIVANFIPLVAESADDESLRDVVRSFVTALIWIPYFLRSERVKNTFINRLRPEPISAE